MEELGIICRADSQWASPLHMVPELPGGWRPGHLNDATIPDGYPVPHIQDFTANLASMRVFSKIDLVRGYHQIPIHKENFPKTAVITPFSLWEFLHISFGLKNAAQSFQRLIWSSMVLISRLLPRRYPRGQSLKI